MQSNAATYQEDGSDVDDETEEDGEGGEYLVEQTLERVQKEEEEKNRDDSSVDSDGSDGEDDDLDNNVTEGEAKKGGHADGEREHPRKKHVWYYKIEVFINHVREIN